MKQSPYVNGESLKPRAVNYDGQKRDIVPVSFARRPALDSARFATREATASTSTTRASYITASCNIITEYCEIPKISDEPSHNSRGSSTVVRIASNRHDKATVAPFTACYAATVTAPGLRYPLLQVLKAADDFEEAFLICAW